MALEFKVLANFDRDKLALQAVDDDGDRYIRFIMHRPWLRRVMGFDQPEYIDALVFLRQRRQEIERHCLEALAQHDDGAQISDIHLAN